MQVRGFDAPRVVSAIIPRVKAQGFSFIARYYSYNANKNLTPSEARTVSAAGLDLVAIWEAAGDHISNFTTKQGEKDAAEALRLAQLIGQPEGSGIYFAVDFDPKPAQIITAVLPYFLAVNRGIGGKYRVGNYGSGLVCSTLREAKLSELFMLGAARGWQGTKTFTGAHLQQALPTNPGLGIQVDPDLALNADFGQFRVPLTA